MKASVTAQLQILDLADQLPRVDQLPLVDQLLRVYQPHQASQPIQVLAKGKESLVGGAQTLTLITQNHKILHQ